MKGVDAMKFTVRKMLGAVCLLVMSGGVPLVQGAESAESASVIEEIVVMARKRAENLQETPISVTAFTTEGLEARNILKVDQVAEASPNVVFEPTAPLTGSTNNGSIFIRGIGTTEFSLGTEPGVGVYVDDVYMARTIGNVLDVVDVEDVEVLRGPQGTLFGRNSAGGAIIIRSKRPDEEFSGKVRAGYGTDNTWEVHGSASVPLHETLLSRVSFLHREQDGYVKDITGQEDFGSKNSWVARGTLEWMPLSNFTATGRIDYTREDNSAAPYVLVDLFEENPFAPGVATFVALQNLGLGCAAGVAGNTGGSCVDQYYVRGPHETAFGYSTDSRFLNDFNKEKFQSRDFTEVWGGSLTLDWDVYDINVKSVTAYRQAEARNPRNPDHTPFQVLEANSDLEQNQLSTELQVSGQLLSDRLDWILGYFFMHEEGYQLDSVDLWPVTLFSGGDFENENWAVFAQGTYSLLDNLDLTVGVRYTEEDKTFRSISDEFLFGRTQVLLAFRPLVLGIPGSTPADDKIEIPPIPLFDEPSPLTISEVTPHASLAWRITDDLMSFASYSKGYKAGGFEQRLALPTAQAPTFESEFVDAYELGFKSVIANRTLRLNGSVFYMDYEGIQCAVVKGIAPTTINCGSGEILGVEFEGNWVPGPEWLIDFNVGYLDAQWAKGTLTPEAATVGISENNKFAMIPEWQTAVGVSYEFGLGSRGTVTPRVDWSYRSEIYKDAPNTEVLRQDGLHLLNVSIVWLSLDEKYEIAVRGRNITDEEYIMTGVMQPDGGFAEAVYSRGAEWWISAQYNF